MQEKMKKMKTGTDAKETGMYSSECCDYEVEFSEQQTFTRCPKCNALTSWEMVEMDLLRAA
jgi:anaerobic ribonucleoside-triphosphate reductase